MPILWPMRRATPVRDQSVRGSYSWRTESRKRTNACRTFNSEDLSHSELMRDWRLPNQYFIITASLDSPSMLEHSNSVSEFTAERYMANRKASRARDIPCMPASQASEMLCCIVGAWVMWVSGLILAR